MNVFVICSVRNATPEQRAQIEAHVATLEAQGHNVYYPARDTNQQATGLDICRQNREGIRWADEVHVVYYDPESQGTHFDMGMAFASGKRVKAIGLPEYGPGKSFPRMLAEWEAISSSVDWTPACPTPISGAFP